MGNPDEVAHWLSPGRAQPLITTGQRITELTVESPTPLPEDEIGAVDEALSPKQHAAYRHLCHILRTQSPCLVFVNSRSARRRCRPGFRRWHPISTLAFITGRWPLKPASKWRMNCETAPFRVWSAPQVWSWVSTWEACDALFRCIRQNPLTGCSSGWVVPTTVWAAWGRPRHLVGRRPSAGIRRRRSTRHGR